MDNEFWDMVVRLRKCALDSGADWVMLNKFDAIICARLDVMKSCGDKMPDGLHPIWDIYSPLLPIE